MAGKIAKPLRIISQLHGLLLQRRVRGSSGRLLHDMLGLRIVLIPHFPWCPHGMLVSRHTLLLYTSDSPCLSNGLDFPHCVTALVGATTRGYNTLFWCGNNRISGTQTLSPTPYEWDATCRSTPTTPSPTPTPSPSTTTTSTVIPTPTETPKPGPPVAAIAGGVVGGLAGLALIILAIFFAFRWGKRKGQTPEAPPQAYIPPQPPHPQPSPDQPPVMTYAAAPAQYVYHPTEPAYSQDPAPTTPYWPGSAGARKTSFEEHVAAAGSPQSAQTAQFPSSQPSPDPRVSQFSASTAVGSGPGSPRGWRGPAELGAERADGELREMRG
ncbi:hypothetical protein OQA88_5836 [Cercophora sp. LCS_1]